MKKSPARSVAAAFLFCAPALLAFYGPNAATVPALAAPSVVRNTSFEDFDRRARAGERLSVVFFGASLTWGANASDPLRTSYRANIADRLEARYPLAHFKFHDAAIGGTGSQLGVFRLQRDVANHNPDLVFLDFSANDDIYGDDKESLAAYESLVRRVVTQIKCPLVQVIFPFEWNVKPGEMAKMKRRDAHLAIARAYGVPVGDAIELISRRVQGGEVQAKDLWPFDGVHPGDKGYAMFADAAWGAFENGVRQKMVPQAPQKELYGPGYMTWNRVRISQLGPLPEGWSAGQPNRVSAYFDFLMSRWLDDEVIASNRAHGIKDAAGNEQNTRQSVNRLKVYVSGQYVMLLGETTLQSGKYQVYIDGKPVERKHDGKNITEFDAASFAKAIGGNGHYTQVIATGLSPDSRHLLEIEPVFAAGKTQELRLESICVAGGASTVSPFNAAP